MADRLRLARDRGLNEVRLRALADRGLTMGTAERAHRRRHVAGPSVRACDRAPEDRGRP